jgi:para-nitrobenzyl esterase
MNKTERPKADGAGEEDGMAPASVVMKGNAATLNSFTDTDRSAPISRDRRRVLGGIAASCAGLAGAAIASSNPLPPSPVAAHPALHEPEVSCGRSKVAASDEATVVETSAGKIRGFKRNGIYIFKGVPYGASTSGANRFMPPLKPEPWSGIRNTLQYGRVCPSQDSGHANTDGKNLATTDEDAFVLHRGAAATIPGEDCLRLNLWTPEINASHKRPVMVYMHGGGFSGGSGHDLLSYDGENLARNHDVVLVNHNHRLNVYGYLNLAALGGDYFASSANVGMLDLVEVLEWVRTHIASFGGDPNNVTIFGQSGGGGKVLALMAMPAAKGLFHRAIVQSGPFLKSLSPEYSGRLAGLVVAELGLSKSRVRELQGIPVDRLSWAAAEAMKKMPSQRNSIRQVYGEDNWGPTMDGGVLPRHPFDPGAPEISADVPLLTGSNLHEFVNGLDRPEGRSMEMDELHRLVSEEFGDRSKEIIGAYRWEYPQATPFDLYATIAAASVRRPAFEQALRKAALETAPAYSYIYAWRTPVLNGRPGPFHAAEISFTFDNAALCDHYSGGSAEAIVLSKQIGTAWVSFARSGNPNHADLPHWPKYTFERRATMQFDRSCQVRNEPERQGLELIAEAP